MTSGELALEATLHEAFERRVGPGLMLADEADAVAAACEAMAQRFLRGGTLLVFGAGARAADAAHVAVEFVHPVIVGKRALPALSLAGDVATLSGIAAVDAKEMFAAQIALLARPDDIALGLALDGREPAIRRGLQVAHGRGLLTIALAGGDGGDLVGDPAVNYLILARSADPRVVKEAHVTTYHVLWELVHVFFEQPVDSVVGRP